VVIELRSNWVTTVLAGFQTLRMLIKARSGLINCMVTGCDVLVQFGRDIFENPSFTTNPVHLIVKA
jgi:hypothetical protein